MREWKPCRAWRTNALGPEKALRRWVITEVGIVEGSREASSATVGRSPRGRLGEIHRACQLGGLEGFRRHVFSRVVVTEARPRD